MVVRLLGTGSADGVPAMFGRTRVDEFARKNRGKDIRTRSAALIDGQLKVDLPPDTNCQLQRDGLCADEWIGLVFTHADDDHFTPSEIQYGIYPFLPSEYAPFPIYGNTAVCEPIRTMYPDWPIELIETRSFETYSCAEYEITPIAANHTRGEDCHNLIIDDGKTKLLYATDTGFWHEETWRFLEGWTLDGIVLECAAGRIESWYWGHINAEQFFEMIGRLRAMKVLGPDAIIVTTHHDSKGELTHEEAVALFEPHGVVVGFDGMEFEI